MKRYLVFAYSLYYPYGGWNDFVGSFDKMIDAIEAGKKQDKHRFQVVDTQDMTTYTGECEQ